LDDSFSETSIYPTCGLLAKAQRRDFEKNFTKFFQCFAVVMGESRPRIRHLVPEPSAKKNSGFAIN
jgi:hypothetical protein